MPPLFVIGGFLLAVAAALALMAYLAWRGSKPSEFFLDAVSTTYELQLPEAEINAYYDMKEKLQRQHPPPASAEGATAEEDEEAIEAAWAQSIPPDDRQNLKRALMRRLVCCIERLDQVQRDKPGNWKLWRGKLVSERYWSSLCDAEKLVSEEIDSCVSEAEVLEPGWRQHIFPQAVQIWRLQKQQDMEKKVQKKAVVNEKKEKEREVKRKEQEERQKEEDKLKQERLAEKMMEKLLREEEKAAASKSKAKPKAKADAKQKVSKRK